MVLDSDTTASYALVAREDLFAGDILEGPAVVTEHTATTVLHEGARLTVCLLYTSSGLARSFASTIASPSSAHDEAHTELPLILL